MLAAGFPAGSPGPSAADHRPQGARPRPFRRSARRSCGDRRCMPEAARRRMVERQLRARGIHDARVLAAMERVPRELFVPDGDRARAYEDEPLPIGYGQTISQPCMVALICQEAAVHAGSARARRRRGLRIPGCRTGRARRRGRTRSSASLSSSRSPARNLERCGLRRPRHRSRRRRHARASRAGAVRPYRRRRSRPSTTGDALRPARRERSARRSGRAAERPAARGHRRKPGRRRRSRAPCPAASCLSSGPKAFAG